MYLIRIDHITYSQRGGQPFTLPGAMRAVYGTGNAAVLREDGTVIVSQAGSSNTVTHVPTGRRIHRRQARHSR